MSRAWLLSWLVLLACSQKPPHQASPTPARAATAQAERSCDYDVVVEQAPELVLRGRVACRGFQVARFEPVRRELTPDFELESSAPGSARYTVRLDRLARRVGSADIALRVGRSLLAPASSYLPRPVPQPSGVSVRLHVGTPPGLRFESGLARDGDGYVLMAHEIDVASYGVFGSFEVESMTLPLFAHADREALVTTAFLDARLHAPPRAVREWIGVAANAASRFWHGFPVPRVLIVIVPVPRKSGVSFGKLLPESGPAIVVYVGEHTPVEALRRDWILVHELFHLGVPSFVDEGKWFDEGLATYFEPLLRHRAGLLDDRELWSALGPGLKLGAAALSRQGLDELTTYRELYWGGAVLCFLADAEARRRSGGRLGLEDGLRRVLAAGGNASEVWALSDVLETVDRTLGAPLLSDLARRHARPNAVALPALLGPLGVSLDRDRSAPSSAAALSDVRRALERGSTPTPSAE
jgi:hypothetical protein